MNKVLTNKKGLERLVDKILDNEETGKGTYCIYDVLRAKIECPDGTQLLRVLGIFTDPTEYKVIKLANNLKTPLSNINLVIEFKMDGKSFLAEVQIVYGMVNEEDSVLNHYFYEIKRAETFNEILIVVRHASEHYKKENNIVSVKK